MLRKLFCGLMAAGMLLATSCQQQELTPSVGEEAVVTFNVGTPEIATRAFSDGAKAVNLEYAVYDANGNFLSELTGTRTMKENKADVSIALTVGNKYYVLFWADAENAPYSVDYPAKTMTVDYNGALSNNENLDAFYAYVPVEVEQGAQTEAVELKRPFAQLNIGTNDYEKSEKSGYEPTMSSVKVPVYTTMNLSTGAVDGQTEVEFAYAAIPTEEFPVSGYQYLAMNYLLVPADQELVDIEFSYYASNVADEKTREVAAVPVRRNYRTNLYGSLLTNDVDMNIEIKPGYDGAENVEIVVVSTASDLKDAIDSDVEEQIIVLDGDINLNDLLNSSAPMTRAQAADPTLVIPEGLTRTIDLGGNTLSSFSTQSGKNYEMFLVKGNLTLSNGKVVTEHRGENMGWSSMTTIFDVTAGGILNLEGVTAVNNGGSDMGFVAHLNNWGEVTLNVENSTLKSNYVAVRVFNSGYDMNNVTIKSSTLNGGSNAFWVQNYTLQDFGRDEKKYLAQMNLLNFDIFNGTNTFVGSNDTPIRFGMTDSYYMSSAVELIDSHKVLKFSYKRDGVLLARALSVEEMVMTRKFWSDAKTWAENFGEESWALTSIYDLDAVHAIRYFMNDVLFSDSEENALFDEDKSSEDRYISSTLAEGNDPMGQEYWSNRVHIKVFNERGYVDSYPYSNNGNVINIYAPLLDFHFARAVKTL